MEDDGAEFAALAQNHRAALLLPAHPVGHCGAADDHHRAGGGPGPLHAVDVGPPLLQPLWQLQEHHRYECGGQRSGGLSFFNAT